jgi:hypothetical protein
MLKTVLSLSLVAIAMSSGFARASADDNKIVTACKGKDSKGNAISLTILHDQSAGQYSSSNPASTTIELQVPTGPLHYTVYDNDSETGDGVKFFSS